MVWLKTCPKCRGDLYLRPQIESDEVACIQCGIAMSPPEARRVIVAARRLPLPGRRSRVIERLSGP